MRFIPFWLRRYFRRLWYRYWYLHTPHWQSVRKAALKRAKYKCHTCHMTGVPLDVHHKVYNFYHEKPSDLEVACRSCHNIFHR